MSDTRKDLKSHKKGFGKYGFKKPKRKMTPFALTSNKISGNKSGQLVVIECDIKQDDFEKHNHWHNAKAVRSIRRQEREERKNEKSIARQKLKNELKNELNED